MKFNVFEHSADDVVSLKNVAMATTLHQLVNDGTITKDQYEQFISEYSFVGVKHKSLLDKMRELICMKPKEEGDLWIFPLVKLRNHQPE